MQVNNTTTKTVRLMTCDDSIQAHIIQGALLNEGIESVLHNENMSNIMRGFCSTITGVDIFVFEDDFQRAKEIVDKNNFCKNDDLCCPLCGGKNIKTSFRKGAYLKAFIAIILSLFCCTPPGSNYFEHRCKDCGNRF